MASLLALTVGALVAAAAYLMLARNLLRFLFGLILLSNAANLLIFAAGRPSEGAAPLIPQGLKALSAPAANALPQALVLTAIVIGLGLFAFALALAVRGQAVLGDLDADRTQPAQDDAERPR